MMLEKRWQWFVVLLLCVLGARVAKAVVTDAQISAGGVFSDPVHGEHTVPPGIVEHGGGTWSKANEGAIVYSRYNQTLRVYAWNQTGTGTYGGTYVAQYSISYANLTYEPQDLDGILDLEGFEEIKFNIMVDTDGDGIPDTTVSSQLISDGQTFTIPTTDAAWAVVAVEGTMSDGTKVPLNQTAASGTGTSAQPSPTPSVSYSPGSPIQHVTVDGSGNVTSAPITTGQPIVNGEPMVSYTYQNSTGGSTTVLYSGTSGTDGAKTQDVRTAAAQNSAENERILAALNSLGQKIDAANSGTAGIPLVSVPSNPVPADQLTIPSYADALEKGEDAGVLAGEAFQGLGAISTSLANGTGYPTVPTLSSAYGSSLSWNITLPVLGAANVDLNAYATYINAFRELVKFVLATVAFVIMVKLIRGAFV